MEGKKPYLAVVIIHILYTGMFSLSKDALNGGMSTCVRLLQTCCRNNLLSSHNFLPRMENCTITIINDIYQDFYALPIRGVFLMLLSNVFWSIWLIFPGLILKSYPSKLLCTALQCFLSTIQSFIIAIALVRDPNEWKLGWSVRLISVAYSGIVVAGVTFYLQAWVIEKKGPVFLAVTPPRLLVFTMCTQRSSCVGFFL
ncbi:unnamed protein product, partial [Coffea canephora]